MTTIGRPLTAALMFLAVASLAGCIAGDDPQHPGIEERSSEQPQGLAAPSHCIAAAVATPIGEPPAKATSAVPLQCFATFSEAIFAATNGRVRLPASATPATVNERTLNSGAGLATSSDFVIAIEYQDSNHGGNSLIVPSSVTCDGFDLSYASLSPFGWNDKISSAFAFSGCNNSFHYEHDNFGGAVFNCFTNCDNLGAAMNDRTSSILWTN